MNCTSLALFCSSGAYILFLVTSSYGMTMNAFAMLVVGVTNCGSDTMITGPIAAQIGEQDGKNLQSATVGFVNGTIGVLECQSVAFLFVCLFVCLCLVLCPCLSVSNSCPFRFWYSWSHCTRSACWLAGCHVWMVWSILCNDISYPLIRTLHDKSPETTALYHYLINTLVIF
jgi:hypothetical protein